MDFIVLSLCIVAMTKLTVSNTLEEIVSQLMALEEDQFVTRFHQQVQKACENSWHDRHIKHKKFQIRDLVIIYEIKFLQHPEKFKMH
jgi:hypothetical protein